MFLLSINNKQIKRTLFFEKEKANHFLIPVDHQKQQLVVKRNNFLLLIDLNVYD